MIPINKRLKKVSEYVTGDVLADIGSDHAFLPMFCIENGLIDHAIAGEVIKGPYQSAVKSVQLHGYQSKIDVRLGDGLTILTENDKIDTVAICGMGGPLIARILKEGAAYIQNQPRLVLQSNIQSQPIREFLQNNGYQITTETLMKERAHIYEIIVADPGKMQLSERDLKFGPFLHPSPNDLFIEKWERELEALSDIKKNLNPEKHKQRWNEINNLESDIKEVLPQCNSKSF
ncbi:tRNA (adenine(22)-N(1))-methyltransferase [Staphylococcus coagulans]|uniref:tRNA (adenine(22)-N(1))-methyltransferase n=1 Tax=Staphylococcus coagulans TaxID=74706 RepID=UPI00067A13F2|nr:tRNA (adenine(22)-N(1))-methyltransferase TrmK [Staphylococcus coagulans]AKS67011.1 tRNA methyltransferase [Staphylococcus schleiferi]MBA8773374.1 tRNA methyltransferase [Staphylococcus coagulans]MBT2814002.1 tRNA (adenine(22)-N(1))-methyltransferase TrmK [Staphylococcus coagulans]MBT2816321.1 tRNA (adenine(22)-N(1))-methyltransferase TrmK [Staphylococcus coagulans]MBT2836346.1 tRNA (adenine(22)-N(1))-methyltransferase TrmK [Staphylococcus coagulans]